ARSRLRAGTARIGRRHRARRLSRFSWRIDRGAARAGQLAMCRKGTYREMKLHWVAALTMAATWFFAAAVTAGWLPRQEPVPGGVAWVELGPATDAMPRAFFGMDRVMVLRQSDN